jgi:uncharacterized protein (TIGR00159 family)
MLLISLSEVRILDVVDIIIVILLTWQIYKLLKGTIAFNIFIGVLMLYGVWYAVSHLGMRLLTFLLGPFVGFGVLILIIIFQQEVRQFLLLLGNNTLKNRFTFLEKMWGDQTLIDDSILMSQVEEIMYAMLHFKSTKTGALIVISQNRSVPIWNNSGQVIDAKISSQLLKAIFQKESPMHDGAAIVVKNRVFAVSVILPVSEFNTMASDKGLRHRAALGVSEKTRATAFLVSEESGEWSYATDGRLASIKTEKELRDQLKLSFLK